MALNGLPEPSLYIHSDKNWKTNPGKAVTSRQIHFSSNWHDYPMMTNPGKAVTSRQIHFSSNWHDYPMMTHIQIGPRYYS